jgi:hypothetical protein
MCRRPSQLCHLSNRIIRHKEADLAALWDVAFLCDSSSNSNAMYCMMVDRMLSLISTVYNKTYKKTNKNKMEILLCSIQDLIKQKQHSSETSLLASIQTLISR